ncbi:MAG: ATP-binding protein [Planctomycetales bacterium]|nr:ATP-binding protein [Planctomycetales bacterium]
MNNPWIWSNSHKFPTDTAEAKRVLDELLARLADNQWGDHDMFGVHMAVEEALMNAIKHGNQLDNSKMVEVVSRLATDRMVIEITDEGPGFEPDDVPDPTEDENLELPSGRGLMLMRSFMNTVEFNDLGNSVRMEKLRTAS